MPLLKKAKIKKIMTYQEANNISIKDYLESLGILPVVDKLYYGMYRIRGSIQNEA